MQLPDRRYALPDTSPQKLTSKLFDALLIPAPRRTLARHFQTFYDRKYSQLSHADTRRQTATDADKDYSFFRLTPFSFHFLLSAFSFGNFSTPFQEIFTPPKPHVH
jgi:hypothetical protein